MKLIHPAIDHYIKSLNKKDDLKLDWVRESSQKEQIPVVEEDVGRFLFLVVLTLNAKKILEIGFGGGYSTLWMAQALSETGKITSLELNTDRIEKGKSAFKKLNLSSKLDLLYIDAFKFLQNTEETFDFIFLDAIKRSYLDYLPFVKRVLRKGGVFVADNILFRGNVVKKKIGAKYQVATSVIKQFNQTLANSQDFETMFLPIGDGLSFSVKV